MLKRERHRQAVAAAGTSGSPKFFLGTDSAPHARHTKEAPCGCAGVFSAPIALALYATAFEQVRRARLGVGAPGLRALSWLLLAPAALLPPGVLLLPLDPLDAAAHASRPQTSQTPTPPHPAPIHPRQAGALDKLEGFASHHGPDFYGLPRNSGTVTLVRRPSTIPEEYGFGPSVVVPMWAGQELAWSVEA